MRIIRAFGYFSHLANIAEDQHHIRRTRAHASGRVGAARRHHRPCADRASRPAFRRNGCSAFFAEALVCPVLTAHPTEVRRKSSLDREMELAQLLAARDRGQFTPEEAAASDESLRRAVLTLWQTSLLRRTKLHGARRGQNGALLLRPHLPAGAAALLRALEDHAGGR